MILIPFFISLLSLASPKNNMADMAVYPSPPTVNKQLILDLVNAVRKKGCNCGDTWYPSAPSVAWNDQLEQAALQHSTDMYRKNYFSHISSEGSNGGDRLDAIGYKWIAYAENIGMGYTSEKEVVEAWVKSPSHCKNMMGKDYKEMGVARVGLYWTQDFGSR